MATDPHVRDYDKFMLRLPEGMRDRIARAAKSNGRSMNAEIISSLEEIYPQKPTPEEVKHRIRHAIDILNHGDIFDEFSKVYLAYLLDTLLKSIDGESFEILSAGQFRAEQDQLRSAMAAHQSEIGQSPHKK